MKLLFSFLFFLATIVPTKSQTSFDGFLDEESKSLLKQLVRMDTDEARTVLILGENHTLDVFKELPDTLQNTLMRCYLDEDSDRIYRAVVLLLAENGMPQIRRKEEGRSAYEYTLNECHINPNMTSLSYGLPSLIAEIAHAQQWSSDRASYTAWYHRDCKKTKLRAKKQCITYDAAQLEEYHLPFTLEYEAHHIIEPMLQERLLELLQILYTDSAH